MAADGTSFAPLRAEPIENAPTDLWASALGRYRAARDEQARTEDAHLACLALVRAAVGPPPTVEDDTLEGAERMAARMPWALWRVRAGDAERRLGQPALETAYFAAVADARTAASALLRAPAQRLGDVLLKAQLAADRLELDLTDPEDVAVALGRDDHALSALIELHRDLARQDGAPSPTAHVVAWRPGEWLARLADEGHALDLGEGPVRYAPGALAQGSPPDPEVFDRWCALGFFRQSRLVEHARRAGPRAAVVEALIAAARLAPPSRRIERLEESAAARRAVPKEVELARLALRAEPTSLDAAA